MTKLNAQAVLEALAGVNDPELERSLVDLGMVRDVEVATDGKVSFTVVLTTPACPLKAKIGEDCRAAVSALEGVSSVEISFGANVRGPAPAPDDPIPGVKQFVLVMSGKGGVGKSTLSASLALALARAGARVGILDADIHGPSLPALLGSSEPARASRDGRIIPAVSHGLRVLSMGHFLERDSQAVIWRGPMLSSLLRQFLTGADWGELDYLIADLPPGTGDAALTLIQTARVTGVVIVTTPQDVAVLDVRKAVDLCGALGVPVIGVVENMSYFECPSCGARHEVFGSGGGEAIAKAASAPLLGRVALDPMIRVDGDAGTPTAVVAPDSPRARNLAEIAGALAATISARGLGRTAAGPVPHG
jgi:ATP-binding protein involved in chromosome partitioning